MAFQNRFLIDECLSPKLAELSGGAFQIVHVNHRGLTRQPDHVIARWCVDHEHALITNNARDFRTIYARLEIHPGLVVILPSIARALQIALIPTALASIQALPDLINRLIEVDLEGNIIVSDWPAP
jgi:predicted nuclease of predicted toxin-antitoxin system